jgi:hypothetical protein
MALDTVNVGRSWRTPYKHNLLRKVLGREVSAKPPHGKDVRYLYDMTAGDGVGDGDWMLTCSPGLFVKFAMAGADEHGVTTKITLIEKAPQTYKALRRSLVDRLPLLGWEIVRTEPGSQTWLYEGGLGPAYLNVMEGDAKHLKAHATRGDVVFVHNDPNHMQDFAMPEHFIRRLRDQGALVSSMSTLGCNVGGLRRLPSEERSNWYRQLEDIESGMPHNHNMVVARLVSDSEGRTDAHYWGYAVHGPRSWTPRITDDMRRAFADCELHVGTDAESRRAVMDELFLTKGERGAA